MGSARPERGQYGARNNRHFSTLTTTKGCRGTLQEQRLSGINPKAAIKFEGERPRLQIHSNLGCACANRCGKMAESWPSRRFPQHRCVLFRQLTAPAVRTPSPCPPKGLLANKTLASIFLRAKSSSAGRYM